MICPICNVSCKFYDGESAECKNCKFYYAYTDDSYMFTLNEYTLFFATNRKNVHIEIGTEIYSKLKGRQFFRCKRYFECPKNLQEAENILNTVLKLSNLC